MSVFNKMIHHHLCWRLILLRFIIPFNTQFFCSGRKNETFGLIWQLSLDCVHSRYNENVSDKINGGGVWVGVGENYIWNFIFVVALLKYYYVAWITMGVIFWAKSIPLNSFQNMVWNIDIFMANDSIKFYIEVIYLNIILKNAWIPYMSPDIGNNE